MLILRPIETRDLDDLLALADLLDSMNLPSDRAFLEERIARSQTSFEQDGPTGVYVFALEDCETGRCVGTSSILAKHGVPGNPYYWFEVSTDRSGRSSRRSRRPSVRRSRSTANSRV